MPKKKKLPSKRSAAARAVRMPKFRPRVIQDKRAVKQVKRILLKEINDGIEKANSNCERLFGSRPFGKCEEVTVEEV